MKQRNRQIWLFAFTDLSFLLLISLSLIPSAPSGLLLHLAEMNPPLVPESAELAPVEEAPGGWELHVVAIDAEHPSPFRLVRVDPQSGSEVEILPLGREGLLPALELMHAERARPVLLPEKNSLSHDFLFAAAAISRVWADGRSPTIVQPIVAGGAE